MIDQAANLAVVLTIGGYVVGVLVLYVVIRLAVTHAIRATSKPVTPAKPTSGTGFQDEDGR